MSAETTAHTALVDDAINGGDIQTLLKTSRALAELGKELIPHNPFYAMVCAEASADILQIAKKIVRSAKAASEMKEALGKAAK